MRLGTTCAALLAFGIASKGVDAQRDSLIARRYAKYFTLFREPDLAIAQPAGTPTLRLIWLRSFHDPIVVRLVLEPNSVRVVTSQATLDLNGELSNVRRDSAALSSSTSDRFLKRTSLRDFWTTNVPKTAALGLDGARWIMEFRDGARYHAVDWWSPKAGGGTEGGYRALFLDILSLGNVHVSPNAVY